MKIGVYVGSFNPVHKAHMQIVDNLLKKNILNRVIVIPTLDYWDKKGLALLPHRVAMLKFYENEKIIVDDSKSHLSYTYEIMDAIKRENKMDDIYLIIGADNVKEFHRWKNVQSILQNHVILIPRKGINVIPYIEKFKEKDNFIIMQGDEIDISSTNIRKFIQEGNIEQLRKDLDDDVLRYILDNKLYREDI